MKTNLRSRLLPALCTLLLFSSCRTTNSVLNNGDKWIPADFNPQETTLLIERLDGEDKEVGKMRDFMAKSYPYKYEFVNPGDLERSSGPYANTTLYPFVVQLSSQNVTQTGGTSMVGRTRTLYDCNFYDRETGRQYRPTRRGAYRPSAIFSVFINTVLKRGKGK